MSGELFFYLDDLLLLQSKAADRHNHKGVLGAIRETFLKQMLEDRVDHIKVCTGEITLSDGDDLGQQDVMVRKPGTINTELGGHSRLPASDCSAVIEVKSNAKGTEIRDFDVKAEQIKNDNPEVICGLVCYKLRCRKETILKRAGFVFDKDVDGFIKDTNLNVDYSGLDFIFCLDEESEYLGAHMYPKAFYLKRGIDYELFLKPPFTEYFLREINALIA